MAESLLELRLYVEELLNGRWAGQKENAKFIQGIADSIAEFDNALATTRQDTAKTRALAEREGNSKVVQIATKQSLLLDDIAVEIQDAQAHRPEQPEERRYPRSAHRALE